MIVSIEAISTFLIELVAESSQRRLVGARIGAEVRSAFPDFSPSAFNCRNLRQFIKQYVKGLKEGGRVGPDIAYELAPKTEPLSTVSRKTFSSVPYVALPVPPSLWRAYCNPSYPYTVLGNKETGALRLSPVGIMLGEPWVEISKPSQDSHFEIAKEFVERLEDGEVREILRKALAVPKWYLGYSSNLKRMGKGAEWASFRNGKLKEIFHKSMISLGVPEKEIVQETSINEAPLKAEPAKELSFSSVSSSLNNEHQRLRRLFHSAIDEMSLSELREIKLPLGKVYDFLSSH